MRWGLLLVVLSACGKVQIAADAGKMDAAIDAPPPSVTLSMAQGSAVDAEGGTSEVSVHVHTFVPSKIVNVAFTGALGTYSPSIDVVATDEMGEGSASATFQSGSGAGTEMTTIVGTSDGKMSAPVTASFDVVALQRIGNPMQGTSSNPISNNYLLGLSIAVPADGHLKKVGLIMSGAVSAQVAIYTDNAGNPGALVASIPGTALVAGVNEIPLSTPVALTAGTYWFMVNYNAVGSPTSGTTSVTCKYISLAYGTAPPNPFPAPSTTTFNNVNYYLVVGQ